MSRSSVIVQLSMFESGTHYKFFEMNVPNESDKILDLLEAAFNKGMLHPSRPKDEDENWW